MIIKRPSDIDPSEITDKETYLNRRHFMQSVAGLALLPLLGSAEAKYGNEPLKHSKSKYKVDEDLTSYQDITHYNNFYEFGTDKYSPAKKAQQLITDPWSVTIAGHCEKPGNYALEDILKPHTLEERIYRLRCVEGWSMVVPWIGFSLADLIKRFAPTSKAKYVKFTSLADKKQMPGIRRRTLAWPYVEGLRMDEAMNELAFVATGMYGEPLPKQSGSPIRLVLPWKYGYKGAKAVVRIEFMDSQPATFWNDLQPSEYPFLSNVNPNVPHPRWSQASERYFVDTNDIQRLPTQLFNGYTEWVGELYPEEPRG